MEIFISYNANPRDTKLAKRAADIAREFSQKVYFTGDDSRPVSSREETLVLKAIRKQLSSTDIFIAIGTRNYTKGFWCELELGIAMERRSQGGTISIIPLWFDPHAVEEVLATLNASRVSENDLQIIKHRIATEVEVVLRGKKISTKVAEKDANNPFSVREERELFDAYVERHDERLTKRQKKELGNIERERSPPARIVREPKFMLYEHSNSAEMSLLILDTSAQVDLNRLRSFEKKYRLIKRKAEIDLTEIGFKNNEVHPMFRVERGVVKHIILDANILFQALMFPDSPVKLPGLTPNFKKHITTISSFFRALRDFWREDLEYAYCTSRSWKEDPVYHQLEELGVYTRFAPTPSNSLHLGNLKAALIPYILHLKRERGNFLLRFDDTDQSRIGKEYYEAIISDLRWIGIPVRDEMVRFQSSEKEFHKAFIDLLASVGMTEVVNGKKKLADPENDHYYFWLDTNSGPIIRRGHLPTEENGSPLNLDIEDKDANPLYKLAGTVDDLLFSSHIFRGRQQLLQGLTDRQAFIHSCIREAIDSLQHEERERLDNLIQEHGSRHIEVTRRPLPLFAPLIYCHLGEVVDDGGNILSKRNSSPTISNVRAEATFLPEAVAAHFIFNILKASPESSINWSNAFDTLCQFGLDPFYAVVAEKMDLDSLKLATRPETLSENDIRRWERRILYRCSLSSLERFVARIPPARLPIEKRAKFSRQILTAIRAETNKTNRALSCWEDVNSLCSLYLTSSDVVTRLKQERRRNSLKTLFLTDKRGFERQITSLSKDAKIALRKRLFNGERGPRLYTLPTLVGIEALNRLGGRL